MNLILIGYRGAGKSAVAQALAGPLGLRRVSTDEEIIRRTGRSIPDLVAEQGWPAFRDLEAEIVRQVCAEDGLLIDTGGGVIERTENAAALRSAGLVVWLRASVATIVSRIEKGSERPALVEGKTFTDEVNEVLSRRTPLYAAAAHDSVDTDHAAIQDVVARVRSLWSGAGGASKTPCT